LRNFAGRRALYILLSFCAAQVFAEKPALEHLFPAGATPGTTNTLTLSGKFEPWPPHFWAEGEGISFNAETNKGKVEITVTADVKAGPRLIRIYNDEGASDPRIFVIGAGREIIEAEPNDLFSKAEELKELPVTINGRFEKRGDVDCFALHMRAGEWLDARVDSYTLESKLDCVLRLVDGAGYELALNHDWATFDPRLIWRAPTDQKVVLEIFGFAYPANSDIQLSGGDGAIYRLHIAASKDRPADICEQPTEKEPNDSIAEANPLECDRKIIGVINNARDEDRFQFAAKKDEMYEFAVVAASLGSPLDSWLRIEDSRGKELARNDDSSGSRDPRLEWKALAETNYIVALGSVTHRGGSEYRYDLSMRKLLPDFKASAPANAFAIAPGSTNEVKMNVKRLRGFTNELSAAITLLPEQVKAESVTIPQKDGEVILKMVAATNAPAFNGPISIVITDATAKSERKVPFELVSRSEDNGVPGGYSKLLVESTDALWLTVLKPKAPEEKKEEKKQ